MLLALPMVSCNWQQHSMLHQQLAPAGVTLMSAVSDAVFVTCGGHGHAGGGAGCKHCSKWQQGANELHN